MSWSLAPYILRRPALARLLVPVADWYMQRSGYRQLGLKADDLLEEESDSVQKALGRLSPKESYDRIYRLRRAVQCDIQHKLLPKDQWTKPEEDTPYLTTIIEAIEAEEREREALDSAEMIKKQH